MCPRGSFVAPPVPVGAAQQEETGSAGGFPDTAPSPPRGWGPPHPCAGQRWGHGVVPSLWGASGPRGGLGPWGRSGPRGARGNRGAWGLLWGVWGYGELAGLGVLGVRRFGGGGEGMGQAPGTPRPAHAGPDPDPAQGATLSHGPAAASAAQVSSCRRQPRQAAGPRGAGRHGTAPWLPWGCAEPAAVASTAAPTRLRPPRRRRSGDGGTAPCAPGTLLHRLLRLDSLLPPSPSPRGPRGAHGGGRPPRWHRRPRCRDVGHPTRCCWPPEPGAQALRSRRRRWLWRVLLLAWLSLGCGIGTAQVRAQGHPRAGPTVPPQPRPQISPSFTQGSAPEVLVRGPEPPARARPRRQLARGAWGPWGPWSACSSSCGDGVAFRARRCLR